MLASSENETVLFDFKEILSTKDSQIIAEKVIKDSQVTVLDYHFRPYSDQKIGYLSSHQCLEIKVSTSDGSQSVLNFFVKTIPYDLPQQAIYMKELDVFRQETGFFKHIVPLISKIYVGDFFFARCYFVKDDIIVLEDLSRLKFSMRGREFDEEIIKSGLKALANLHAASLVVEDHLGKPLNQLYPDIFEQSYFAKTGNQYRWYRAGVDVAVRIAEKMGLKTDLISATCDQVFEAVKPSKNKRNVISHGDLWGNNLLFDDKSPPNCRLVDFQILMYSPMASDVAQFLYLCASRELRDSKSKELLKFYYKELLNYLRMNSSKRVVKPSWQEFIQGYEERRIGAAVIAMLYCPTTLLDAEDARMILNDPESYVNFRFENRSNFVMEAMKRDKYYNERMREIVGELVEFSLKLESMPKPT